MKRYFRYLTLCLLTVVAAGCIENDIPYPVEKIDVLAIDVEGASATPVIDATTHSIAISLEETTDIRNVNIRSLSLSEGATSDPSFPGVFDLRNPMYQKHF